MSGLKQDPNSLEQRRCRNDQSHHWCVSKCLIHWCFLDKLSKTLCSFGHLTIVSNCFMKGRLKWCLEVRIWHVYESVKWIGRMEFTDRIHTNAVCSYLCLEVYYKAVAFLCAMATRKCLKLKRPFSRTWHLSVLASLPGTLGWIQLFWCRNAPSLQKNTSISYHVFFLHFSMSSASFNIKYNIKLQMWDVSK